MAPDPRLDPGPAAIVRRFLQSRRASTAVEFALIGPLLLLLVLVIIENGLMLFAQAVLDNATVAAARQVQIGAITDQANFRNAVCTGMSSFLNCTNLQVYVASSTTSFPATVSPSSSGTFASSSFSSGSGSSYVLVEVAYNRAYVAPWLISLVGTGWILLSVQAFQNEPFS